MALCLQCGKESRPNKHGGWRKYCSDRCSKKRSYDPEIKKLYRLAHKDAANKACENYRTRRYRLHGGFIKSAPTIARHILRDQLKNAPCLDCQGWFPAECMDWDHRDPDTKDTCVANIFNAGFSKARLFREIAKCDLICSNCHRIRTKHRKRPSKYDKVIT